MDDVGRATVTSWSAIDQLAKIWMKNGWDPKSLLEEVPEIYKDHIIGSICEVLIGDGNVSPEMFEDMLLSMPKEYWENAFEWIWIKGDFDNEEHAEKISAVITNTNDGEIAENLRNVLDRWEEFEKEWEENYENEESDF